MRRQAKIPSLCLWASFLAIALGGLLAADEPKSLEGIVKEGAGTGQVWLGVALNVLEDKERPEKGPGAEARLQVDRILPDSPASKADIREGDLIVAIGDHKINDFTQFLQLIGGAEGKTLKLHLARGDKSLVVEVKPTKRPAAKPAKADDSLSGQQESAEKVAKQLREARERLEKLLQGQLNKQPGPQRPSKPFKPNMSELEEKFRLYIEGNPPPPAKALAFPAPLAGLPNDMEVTIQRKGNQPARITVKQGHREWRTIETDLEILPPQAQQYVARALGKNAPAVGTGVVSPLKGGMLFVPEKHGAIELKLKLGPGGVVESAEAQTPRAIIERRGDFADPLWRDRRPSEAASPSDQKGKEDEVNRLRDEILKLHRELQAARKSWDESVEKFIPAPPVK